MRIYHNLTNGRWVVETRVWAVAGHSLPQALWRLFLCNVSGSRR